MVCLMNEIVTILLIVDLLILMLIGPMYFGSLRKMLAYMKTNRGDLWEDLGRPTLILNNSIGNSSQVIRFLIYRKYEGSDDADFVRLCCKARKYLYISFILGIFLILLTIPLLNS